MNLTKLATIIGVVLMILFGFGTIKWLIAIFTSFGYYFDIDSFTKLGICIAMFFVGFAITRYAKKIK